MSLLVFFNGLKLKLYICNRCHNLLMTSMNLSDIAISKIKNPNYCCIITGVSKSEVMKLMQNINLTEKNRKL